MAAPISSTATNAVPPKRMSFDAAQSFILESGDIVNNGVSLIAKKVVFLSCPKATGGWRKKANDARPVLGWAEEHDFDGAVVGLHDLAFQAYRSSLPMTCATMVKEHFVPGA